MAFPAPTRADHLRFCEIEGWKPVRSSRGTAGTHHETFELELADGSILRTRISRPPDRSTYGPAMWSHILRSQLAVTEAAFWACVRQRTLPDRPRPAPPENALPLEIAHLLATHVGLSADEVAELTKEEAIARLNEFWSRPQG